MRAIRGRGLRGGPAAPTLDTRPPKDAVANPSNLLSREIEA